MESQGIILIPHAPLLPGHYMCSTNPQIRSTGESGKVIVQVEDAQGTPIRAEQSEQLWKELKEVFAFNKEAECVPYSG